MSKSHWKKFGLLYLALVVVVILLLFYFPSDDKTISKSIVGIARPAPGITFFATLERNSLQDDSDETLIFEAGSDLPGDIVNLQVCVDAPMFTLGEQRCLPVRAFGKRNAHVQRPSVVWHLLPQRTSGKSKILITASWERLVPRSLPAIRNERKNKADNRKACADDVSSCDSMAEKVVMSLGPVNLGINRLSRFAGRLSRFIKDLTLPILLIILTQWFTSKAGERETQRRFYEEQQRRDSERHNMRIDKAQRKMERQQEEEKQIAHILLPKVMQLAGDYYLPLTWNAERFVKISAVTPMDTNTLTFHLVSFLLIMRDLKENVGGIFFKDLTAESILHNGNRVIRSLAVTVAGGEREYMVLLDSLKSWVPAAEKRLPRLAEQPLPLPVTWDLFDQWLKGLHADQMNGLRFLFNGVTGVLRFESNAPYEHWYSGGTKNKFEVPQEIDPPDPLILGSQFAEELAEFASLLSKYRSEKQLRKP